MNEVLAPGNLLLSVVCGLLTAAYLSIVHPTTSLRAALLRAFELGAVGTILYIARILFSIISHAISGGPSDVERVTGGWLLWLLFSVSVAVGKFIAVRRQRKAILEGPA